MTHFIHFSIATSGAAYSSEFSVLQIEEFTKSSPGSSYGVSFKLTVVAFRAFPISMFHYSFFLGSLLASFKALLIIHSIWPLVLRNSSAAHFSTAERISGSNLNTKGFFLAITNICLCRALYKIHPAMLQFSSPTWPSHSAFSRTFRFSQTVLYE